MTKKILFIGIGVGMIFLPFVPIFVRNKENKKTLEILEQKSITNRIDEHGCKIEQMGSRGNVDWITRTGGWTHPDNKLRIDVKDQNSKNKFILGHVFFSSAANYYRLMNFDVNIHNKLDNKEITVYGYKTKVTKVKGGKLDDVWPDGKHEQTLRINRLDIVSKNIPGNLDNNWQTIINSESQNSMSIENIYEGYRGGPNQMLPTQKPLTPNMGYEIVIKEIAPSIFHSTYEVHIDYLLGIEENGKTQFKKLSLNNYYETSMFKDSLKILKNEDHLRKNLLRTIEI